ncbi:MAG: adenylate/guanylate cyclase domain-containing protein, partial [Mariprofundus sp.]
PINDQDHARHAAKAGLAICMACKKLGVTRADGKPISFRIGLNCGDAIVGNIGAAKRLEYTVIGDAVNVASRMGGLGSGGELVMSRQTFALLGEGFDFHAIGKRDIKGISQDIEVGQVMAHSQQVRQNIEHVVDLAFDFELPTDIQQITGDT